MTPREADDRQWADMIFGQLSRREVKWRCVFCQHEVPYESAPCCGEIQSEPMTDEECDENE